MSKLTLTAIATITALTFSAGAQAEKIAIIGGTVHTMTEQGAIENATVLIEDGKISKVISQEVSTDASYRVIDAKGKVVTPGFIGAFTSLGLVEVSSWAGTNDASVAKSKLHAALDASLAVNPDSTLINISRIEGITSAATSVGNTDSIYKGRGAVITLGDDADPVMKKRAFMSIDLSNSGADVSGGSRAALWVDFRNALNEAIYAQSINFTPQTEWHGTLSKANVQALIPVVKGEMPLLVQIHRASDIRRIIKMTDNFKRLNVTLVGASEAWRVADEIAAAGMSVILNPESNLPYTFEQNGATLANAARLNDAGVNIAIGMNTHNIRLAPQHAGNAVANGLPWQAGLASLTTAPAKIYGIDKQVGSIKAGMQADVVIWSGDPLEVMHAPTNVIINGEEVPLESRQTKLRDRYLKIDNEKPQQYTRP
ncbi:amidohydrolase family protein [Thalassotalea fonticola]|uniref:Amidohydrolase family protein n=1 Tax=Thalassotalea fonticola TaxID=3065649 RepID=A0ABZ0GJP8_9GAMM|nr:amidohydrolase family protein [Colwelliaceae bacterium S1-1]